MRVVFGVLLFMFLTFVSYPGDVKGLYNPVLAHHVIWIIPSMVPTPA